MDSLILPRSFFFVHSTESFGFAEDMVKTYKGSSGSVVYANVPVFRTGTFADSSGEVTTWEPIHLDTMMANGDYLSKNGVMLGWPVRDGHKSWIAGGVQGNGNTVGWTENMRVQTLRSPVDNQEYNYLIVDHSITDPYAQDKRSNGTWRNRSSEIGTYKTNTGVELGPTFMGFAFVDIPAVEGLNFSSSNGSKIYVDLKSAREHTTREIPMPEGTGTASTIPGAALLPPLPVATPAAQHAAPAVPAAPASAAQPFMFTIGGTSTQDPTTVQLYVNNLETVIIESRTAARTDFVNGLVSSNRVLASQQAAFLEFGLGLNDGQWTSWCAQMLAQPASSIVSQHAVGTGSHAGAVVPAGSPDKQAQAVKDAQDRVKMHKNMGATAATIKNTASYKFLVAAGVSVDL